MALQGWGGSDVGEIRHMPLCQHMHMHMQHPIMPAMLVQRSSSQKLLRAGDCLSVARMPRFTALLVLSIFAMPLGPIVLRTVRGAGVGGNGGNGGEVMQQSDTNQHGHHNSGKIARPHLLSALSVDGIAFAWT